MAQEKVHYFKSLLAHSNLVLLSIYKDGKIGALLELGSGFNPEFTGLKENVYLNGKILGLSQEEICGKI